MGCSHCMNSATKDGKHMVWTVYKAALDFVKKYGTPIIILTGGEPTEHPDFLDYLWYALKTCPDNIVCVTTNGLWMQENPDIITTYLKEFGERLMIQVTSVKKYYPVHIDLSLPVFNQEGVFVFTEIDRIYPQGRAKDNNIPWFANGSKCINPILFAKQFGHGGLKNMTSMMMLKGMSCSPDIGIDGSIRLGESDLCPPVSTIYKSEKEILDDFVNFRCNKCDFINKKLSKEVKKCLNWNL